MRKIIVLILLLIVAGKSFSQPRDYNRDYRKHFFWGIAFAGTSAKMKMELDPVFGNARIRYRVFVRADKRVGIWWFSGLQDG